MAAARWRRRASLYLAHHRRPDGITRRPVRFPSAQACQVSLPDTVVPQDHPATSTQQVFTCFCVDSFHFAFVAPLRNLFSYLLARSFLICSLEVFLACTKLVRGTVIKCFFSGLAWIGRGLLGSLLGRFNREDSFSKAEGFCCDALLG